MIKYLLLGLLIAFLFFASPWGRKRAGKATQRHQPGPKPPPQEMVACAHCGVHLPSTEALMAPPSIGGQRHFFCNEDHRRAGPRAR